jgi:hypothetical protein
MILLGCNELPDGPARAKRWLADYTFKVCPCVFYQLYTIHFKVVPGINTAAVYCLVEKKQRVTYDHILEQLRIAIPIAAPERNLLDFESHSAFSPA